MNPRYAILIDGGFVTKALAKRLKTHPTADQIYAECVRIMALDHFKGFDLLRIYFYDAPPATQNLTNPIDGAFIDLGKTPVHVRNTQLLDQLEMMPNVAVRKGEAVVRGWKLGKSALREMTKTPRQLEARDLVPNVQQKGVDLRIGLDVARIALREFAQAIVFVGGDSDMVPVFRFARREGVRIYLDHLGMPVRPSMKAHSDIVLC